MTIQSLEAGLAQTALPPYGAGQDGAMALEQGAGTAAPSDAISLSPQQPAANSSLDQASMLSPLSGMLAQLMQMLQQMMGGSSSALPGTGQCAPYGGNPSGSNCPPNGDEQYFASAQGSDDGDPHLSFNGSKWNSMQSHPNLLQSNSIPGGYRLSTQVTNTNARGVSRNQSAQITLDGGRTTIGLNGDGKASIVRNGENVPIAPGQTLQLGSGTTVTCKPNGALSVNSRNAMGGQISTTLSTKNGGVDVNVSAQNVDLGGALVRGQSVSPGPSPVPSPTPGGPPGQFVQSPIMQVPPYEMTPPSTYQEQPATYQEQPTQYDNL
ncbi:MAG TPA: hypothetical protein VGF98_07330 [Candidatus Tumulicola sp.]|jgi:hypothetical protein